MTESASELELPPVTNIRRYRYRKGDHLIVRINTRIDQFTGDRVVRWVSLTMGVPIDDILVLSEGADLKVVRNVPEAEIEAARAEEQERRRG